MLTLPLKCRLLTIKSKQSNYSGTNYLVSALLLVSIDARLDFRKLAIIFAIDQLIDLSIEIENERERERAFC